MMFQRAGRGHATTDGTRKGVHGRVGRPHSESEIKTHELFTLQRSAGNRAVSVLLTVQRDWDPARWSEQVEADGFAAFYTWLNGRAMADMLSWLSALPANQLISVTTHLSSAPASLGAGIPRMRLAIHAASVRKEIGGRGRIPLARMAEIEREIDDCPNLFPDQAGDIRVLLGYAGERRVGPVTESGGPEAAMVGDPGGATPGDGPRAAEAVAQQVFGASGYADRVATYQQVRVFGHTTWVHPEFGAHLIAADADARTRIAAKEGRPFRETDWKIQKMSGFDGTRGGGLHPWGVAVDFNYDSAPYVMHEQTSRGPETEIDNQVRDVYHRIALLVLNRESVIPTQIARQRTMNTAADRADTTLGDRLQEESDAMMRYFRMMQDAGEIREFLRANQRPAEVWNRVLPGIAEVDRVMGLTEQMRLDYRTLSGRAGPSARAGDRTPPAASVGDRPFQGGNAMLRDPQLGFLSIRREIVQALRAEGLRWGGTDFGGSSGDIMHFDMGFQYAARVRAVSASAASSSASPAAVQRTVDPTSPMETSVQLLVQRHPLSDTEQIEEDILDPQST